MNKFLLSTFSFLLSAAALLLSGCAGFTANVAVDKNGNFIVTGSGKLPDNKGGK